MSGSSTEQSIAGLQAAQGGRNSTTLEILELEIVALSASMKKDHAKAIELMKKATGLEESMSAPYGPPGLIKPSHELFGEILLRAGKPAEAAEQFKVALQRQPNRARSLLGLERATKR
jgi:predicted Zn-dependent protease